MVTTGEQLPYEGQILVSNSPVSNSPVRYSPVSNSPVSNCPTSHTCMPKPKPSTLWQKLHCLSV